MIKKTTNTTLACAVGAALVGSLGATGLANAADNPFGMTQLGSGYMQLASNEGSCGGKKAEGSCGGKKAEGSCGGKTAEGSCGGKKAEGSCGGKKAEGSCGGKKTEGKCGEGKCGGNK